MYMDPPQPTSDLGMTGPLEDRGAQRSLLRSLLRNPVLLERSLGVILWTGLVLVLVAKPF